MFLFRKIGQLAILLLVSVNSISGRSQQSTRSGKLPDVYLITIDTLRADHVQCFGGTLAETPGMNSLARHGIRFTQAITPSPITNTSHASILTGRYPGFHGVTDFGISLKSNVSTWAEILRSNGYQTAAFIGATILDSHSLAPGFDRGFDFYDNFDPALPANVHWGRLERRGETVVERATKWMNERLQGPRFVWMHLYDPHDPYEPPEPFATKYKDHPYDGEIAYADQALGHFLSYLKRVGRYSTSLIVVTGDHGEGLGEHGEDTHGIFLYDSTIHVPLIIKLPDGSSSGEAVSAQVRTIDLLPTIVDALRIHTSATFDGSSLFPLLQGSHTEPRIALAETDYPLRFGWAPLSAVRSDGLKYIDAPRPELYDLHNDVNERSNVYEPWNPALHALRVLLAQYTASSEAGRKKGSAPVSEATIQELHALGYFPQSAGETSASEPSLLPDPKDKIQLQNLLHKAMIEQETGNVRNAIAALLRVVEAEPNSIFALSELGQLALQSGNGSQAATYLRKAMALDGSNPELHFHLGQALYKTGDRAAAQQALETSLKLDPENFDARVLLSSVDRELGDTEAATDQLEGAAFLKSNDPTPRIALARILLDKQKYADALKQLEKARAIDKDDPIIYELLAKAYAAQGRRGEARTSETKAAQLKAKR